MPAQGKFCQEQHVDTEKHVSEELWHLVNSAFVETITDFHIPILSQTAFAANAVKEMICVTFKMDFKSVFQTHRGISTKNGFFRAEGLMRVHVFEFLFAFTTNLTN